VKYLASGLRIFVSIYLSILLAIFSYDLLDRYFIMLPNLSDVYIRILRASIAGFIASIVLTLLLTPVFKEPVRRINMLSEDIRKINNLVDAYAVVMKNYQNDLDEIKNILKDIRSKSNDLGVRIAAVEKILSVLLEFYRGEESSKNKSQSQTMTEKRFK